MSDEINIWSRSNKATVSTFLVCLISNLTSHLSAMWQHTQVEEWMESINLPMNPARVPVINLWEYHNSLKRWTMRWFLSLVQTNLCRLAEIQCCQNSSNLRALDCNSKLHDLCGIPKIFMLYFTDQYGLYKTCSGLLSGWFPWQSFRWVTITILFYFVNPNHHFNIFQGALLGKKSALLETGTFTSSNEATLLPGKRYRP